MNPSILFLLFFFSFSFLPFFPTWEKLTMKAAFSPKSNWAQTFLKNKTVLGGFISITPYLVRAAKGFAGRNPFGSALDEAVNSEWRRAHA